MLLLKQAYTPPTIAVQPLPYTLHHGDCVAVMRTLPENSIDAIVTDPPCGIGFMSAKWDTFDDKTHKSRQFEKEERTQEGKWLEGRGTLPYGFSSSLGHSKKERENFIAFMTEVMTEALRCLKPGGHAFVWALPRTSHWTATALEDAGFEIRDVITHLFGSGFPKSKNLGNGQGSALKPASEHWILARKPLDTSRWLVELTPSVLATWEEKRCHHE